MAKGSDQGGFAKKFGKRLDDAFNKAKTAPVEHDTGGELPPMEGVAQLNECAIRLYDKEGHKNKGQYYFYASALVVSPESVTVDGAKIRTKGRRTSIIENLFDTPESQSRPAFEDHLKYVTNVLRLLGLETDDLDGSDLEAACAALKKQKPMFRFRTWRGTKKKPGDAGYNEKYDGPNSPPPRTNHVWGDAISEEEAAELLGENTGGDAEDETDAPSTPAKKGNKPAPAKEPEPEDDDDTDTDTQSNDDDGDTEGDSGDNDDDDNSEPVPDEGDTWYYRPIDKATNKPGKKVQVNVDKVYASKKTADVTQVGNSQKKYKGVSWDKLTVD